MPNYKIFQDVAENLRVKVYASQSGTATAMQMESGALATSLYAKQSGAMVSLQTQSGALTTALYALQSGTITSIQADSGALTTALYAKQSGDLISLQTNSGALATALYALQSGNITSLQMASGALIVSSDIITVDSGAGVAFTSGSSGSGTTVWDVLEYKDWTYAITKSGGAGNVRTKLQISATGSGGDWWDQNGSFESLASGEWNYYVTNVFLRYARINVASSGSGIVHWYFQGQKG